MFAKLLVVAGPDVGKTFEVVPKVPFVIVPASPTATAVNNVFVLEYTLQFGDTLGIGDTILLVQDPDAPEAVPAHIANRSGSPKGTTNRKPAAVPAATPGAPRPAAPPTPSSTPHQPVRPVPTAASSATHKP